MGKELSKFGILISRKIYFRMCDIFKSLDKFRKQFIPMRKIRNNKKCEWMNWEIKRLIRET